MKVFYFGYVGVILINGEIGVICYYEYGCYKNFKLDILGNVRKVGVLNVIIKSGLIIESLLLKVFKEVFLCFG